MELDLCTFAGLLVYTARASNHTGQVRAAGVSDPAVSPGLVPMVANVTGHDPLELGIVASYQDTDWLTTNGYPHLETSAAVNPVGDMVELRGRQTVLPRVQVQQQIPPVGDVLSGQLNLLAGPPRRIQLEVEVPVKVLGVTDSANQLLEGLDSSPEPPITLFGEPLRFAQPRE
jgi:hypothetical protein